MKDYIRLPAAILLGMSLIGCSGAGGPEFERERVSTLGSELNISSNGTGFVGDYYYTFWKDGGSTSMNLEADGGFSVSWQAGSGYNYVGGPGWQHGKEDRVIGYNCGQWTGNNVNSYMTLYGWAFDPLVEYYVLQNWGSYDPTTASGRVQGVNFTSNGRNYTAYKTTRNQKPSILGTQTFDQYWSRPSQEAPLGQTHEINFQDHVDAWRASGWPVGNLAGTSSEHNSVTYQVMAIEVFGPSSSGSANCSVWEVDGGDSGATCGDSVCEGSEDCSNCAQDCGACASDDVWLEAECANSSNGNYGSTQTSQSGYSGAGHITSSANTTATSYSNSTDRATYNFNVSGGSYKVYFRVDTNASADDDSWFYRLNGGSWTMENSHDGTNGWQWVQGAGGTLSLSAGSHSIEVANRESGLDMDKIAIVPSSASAPNGNGGTANNCGGGGGPTCSDNVQNQGETGIDCGGPCAACQPTATCSDNIQNQGETGVDCGGPCAACQPTPALNVPGIVEAEDYSDYSDSDSGNNGTAPNCNNGDDVDLDTTSDNGGGCTVGWTSNGEWLEYDINVTTAGDFDVVTRTGSQVGGSFRILIDGSDVSGSVSTSTGSWTSYESKTVASSLSLSAGAHTMRINMLGSLNFNYVEFVAQTPCVPATSCSGGAECGTQADGCGGTVNCGSCSGGDVCNAGTNMCVAGASCNDGIQNQDETGVDCGGSCGACAPTCSDGIQNQGETDIDCGGSCGACPDGAGCNLPGDCQSGDCTSNVCMAAASCTDGMLNNGETDVDCGGSNCGACANGDSCSVDGDCQSGDCSGGTCQAAGGGACNAGNSTALPKGATQSLTPGQCYSFNKTTGTLRVAAWGGNPNYTMTGVDSQGNPFSGSFTSNWSSVSGVANGTGFFSITGTSGTDWRWENW